MSKKQKYYVVWRGRRTGVFSDWEACQEQIRGYPGAQYKAFPTLVVAEAAFRDPPPERRYELPAPAQIRQPRPRPSARLFDAGGPILPSFAVDAACSGSPGPVEYRCVNTGSGEEIFHQGPFERGTNNIGEFLALVHALALFKKQRISWPIYSDSHNAISWVKFKKCRTKLPRDERNARLFDLIARAETWLRENEYANQVLKWDTRAWGEIPADFGRK